MEEQRARSEADKTYLELGYNTDECSSSVTIFIPVWSHATRRSINNYLTQGRTTYPQSPPPFDEDDWSGDWNGWYEEQVPGMEDCSEEDSGCNSTMPELIDCSEEDTDSSMPELEDCSEEDSAQPGLEDCWEKDSAQPGLEDCCEEDSTQPDWKNLKN